MKKINEIKTSFLNSFPLFGNKLLSTQFVIDNENNPTAKTNGKIIKFNSDYLNKLNYEQTKTLIAHELLHIVELHHLRMRNRDAEIWNSACDYVINLDLLSLGFTPLNNWLIDSKYKGMNAEDVYLILKKESKEKQNSVNNQSKQSGGEFEEPTNSDGEPLTKEELAEEINKGLNELSTSINAVNKAIEGIEKSNELTESFKKEKIKEYGRGRHSAINAINDIKESYKNWKEILKRFLNIASNDDYSFMNMDIETYSITGAYTPNLESEKIGNVILALDVSDSQSKITKEICIESLSIIHNLSITSIPVYYVSSFVHDRNVVYSHNDIMEYNGGGTCFNSFFKTFNEKEFDCKVLVFITDGYVDYSNWETPNCDVLWVMTTSNRDFEENVPFGECVRYNAY